MGVKQLEIYDPTIDPRDNEEREAVDNYNVGVFCDQQITGMYQIPQRSTTKALTCHRKPGHSGDHIDVTKLDTRWHFDGKCRVLARWPNSSSGSKGRHQGKKCECGAASIGSPMHSSWCPLA